MRYVNYKRLLPAEKESAADPSKMFLLRCLADHVAAIIFYCAIIERIINDNLYWSLSKCFSLGPSNSLLLSFHRVTLYELIKRSNLSPKRNRSWWVLLIVDVPLKQLTTMSFMHRTFFNCYVDSPYKYALSEFEIFIIGINYLNLLQYKITIHNDTSKNINLNS